MLKKPLFSRHCAVLVLVTSCLYLSACSSGPEKTQNKTSKNKKEAKDTGPIAVTTLKAKGQDQTLTLESEGKLAVAERFIAKAPIQAKVAKVFVEEGTRVQAGDPLVQFDDQENKLRSAKVKAEAREAEAGIELINYTQTNKEKLVEEGKLSDIESEGLDERLNFYQAVLDRTKAESELVDYVEGMEQLNSPFAGIVSKKSASDSAEVTADEAIVEVVRLDPIYFIFGVPSGDSSALNKNPSMQIRFSSLPGMELSGEIVSIGLESENNEADALSNVSGVPVKIKLNNPDYSLRPGLIGSIVLKSSETRKIYPVPPAVIHKTDRSHYVFKVLEKEKIVKRVSVELTSPLNNQSVVVKGVQEGDTLILTSEKELKDGDAIEITGDMTAKPEK